MVLVQFCAVDGVDWWGCCVGLDGRRGRVVQVDELLLIYALVRLGEDDDIQTGNVDGCFVDAVVAGCEHFLNDRLWTEKRETNIIVHQEGGILDEAEGWVCRDFSVDEVIFCGIRTGCEGGSVEGEGEDRCVFVDADYVGIILVARTWLCSL